MELPLSFQDMRGDLASCIETDQLLNGNFAVSHLCCSAGLRYDGYAIPLLTDCRRSWRSKFNGAYKIQSDTVCQIKSGLLHVSGQPNGCSTPEPDKRRTEETRPEPPVDR